MQYKLPGLYFHHSDPTHQFDINEMSESHDQDNNFKLNAVKLTYVYDIATEELKPSITELIAS